METDSVAGMSDLPSFIPRIPEEQSMVVGGRISNFFHFLDQQLEKNSKEFQTRLESLNSGSVRQQGVNVSGLTDRIRVLENDLKIASCHIERLESESVSSRARLGEVETENELLIQEIEKFGEIEKSRIEEIRKLEKRLILANTENNRLRMKFSSVPTKQFSHPQPATAPTVDREKYRRALMYIDELQRRLRQD